jgi:hypothetical protein
VCQGRKLAGDDAVRGQTPRYPSSDADSFPLLLRARNAKTSRRPGDKAATV